MEIRKLDNKRLITSTGFLIQVKSGSGSYPSGKIHEPSPNANGYRYTYFKGKKTGLHRVMWEIFRGPIPSGHDIDHINGNRVDNNILNLRPLTRSENLHAIKHRVN